MVYNDILEGNKINLRSVDMCDCQQYYLDWLNDEEVNEYLETRWQEQSLDTIHSFVKSIRDSEHSYLFAIISDGKHVGNIKIGPIHPIYKYADVSYFIGDKLSWGRGIASEAVHLITKFGFEVLNLHRLQAGYIEGNIGSKKVLEKNGYVLEATYNEKVFIHLGDEYVNCYMYGILKDNYRNG